jgi:hypothetical protein
MDHLLRLDHRLIARGEPGPVAEPKRLRVPFRPGPAGIERPQAELATDRVDYQEGVAPQVQVRHHHLPELERGHLRVRADVQQPVARVVAQPDPASLVAPVDRERQRRHRLG